MSKKPDICNGCIADCDSCEIYNDIWDDIFRCGVEREKPKVVPVDLETIDRQAAFDYCKHDVDASVDSLTVIGQMKKAVEAAREKEKEKKITHLDQLAKDPDAVMTNVG